MRSIEPHMLTSLHRKKKRRLLVKKMLLVLLPALLAGAAGSAVYFHSRNDMSSNTAAEATGTLGRSTNVVPDDSSFAIFTGEEFQELYESMVFANTRMIDIPPPITGKQDVDKRIREVAVSRGYVLRSVPNNMMHDVPSQGISRFGTMQLQYPALVAWLSLQEHAESEGVQLIVSSAYRSVEDQHKLFLQRLERLNVSEADIVNGNADVEIARVLEYAALPGYSRHHTGYTIDFVCGNAMTVSFEFTECFEWLSKDNYLNAKKHGWIPSYPDDVPTQGPEPEPWEYVWVGVGALLE